MSFRIEWSTEGDQLTLRISGRFDSAAYNEFVKATSACNRVIKRMIIDLTELESIDSSGLGMLLIAREAAGASQVSISGCSSELRRILDIVNFGQLFEIE